MDFLNNIIGGITSGLSGLKNALFNPVSTNQPIIPKPVLTATIGEGLSPLQSERAQQIVTGQIPGPTTYAAQGKVPSLTEYILNKNASIIRPLITTQPTQPTQPIPPPTADRFGRPLPPPPQASSGQPGIAQPSGGGFQQQAQQGAPGIGGISGSQRGASFGGAVGGGGVPSVGVSQEEPKTKKQPQFTMITAQQAQDAARQGLLQGAGQSGVFKDQAGNFYGISNAQIATQFGAPGVAPTPTTTTPTLAPFQTSLTTGPISAEALLSGVPGKLLPTYETAANDLQDAVAQNLANQPPLPVTFAMDTQSQAEWRANQPLSGQQAYDQLYQQLGISSKAAEVANKKREIAALEQGLQTIIKSIDENPELPKGLAARMITDFSNKNAITLRNLQSSLDTLLYEKGELDKDLNQRLGIYEKDITRAEDRDKEKRQSVKDQLSTLISSGAITEMSDSDLQQWAKAAGYTTSSLQAIKKAKATKAADITNVQFKEDAQGNVTAIGLDEDNKPVTLGTLKGVGTPSPSAADTTFSDKVINGRLVRILSNKKTGEVISQTDLGAAGQETTADKKSKFVQYLQQVPANTKTSAELEGEARAAGLTIDDDLTAAIGQVNTTSWLRRALGF